MELKFSLGDLVEAKGGGITNRYLITQAKTTSGEPTLVIKNIMTGVSSEITILRRSDTPIGRTYADPFDDENPDYITGTEDGI